MPTAVINTTVICLFNFYFEINEPNLGSGFQGKYKAKSVLLVFCQKFSRSDECHSELG